MPVASKWIEGLAIDVRHRFLWIDRWELVAFDERAAPEEGGVTVPRGARPRAPEPVDEEDGRELVQFVALPESDL